VLVWFVIQGDTLLKKRRFQSWLRELSVKKEGRDHLASRRKRVAEEIEKVVSNNKGGEKER